MIAATSAPPVARTADVAAAAQLACLLEVSSPKPGNVTPAHAFHDTSYADFLASAVAIGPAIAAAGEQPLGVTVRSAITATRRWTQANTNLGIVLLLAPLARAALTMGDRPLRDAVRATLADTTIADARAVYAAIRLAAPGGLGTVPAQDVSQPPSVSLTEAMHHARARDAVAREYATGFAVTFDIGAPALKRARGDGLSWSDAIVETYLTLLAEQPDTHIARKLGDAAAREVQDGARTTLAAGGVRRGAGRDALGALDRALRDPANRRNPGATADLTTAAIFVTLLDGGPDASA
ncbi:MAG TPA: triphosphoribosyl-dephospho-CoA synthase [Gemmatimonadales bacterium]|nr:triphosphoribosyl-dephospho-CoA synthase [Gemmatimonadales bacterium]